MKTRILSVVVAGCVGVALPAEASSPLVVAPVNEGGVQAERFWDLAIAGLTGLTLASAVGGVGAILPEGEAANLARNALLVGLMIAPPATLVANHETFPAVDATLATWTGGMVGLGSGFLLGRLTASDTGVTGVLSRAALMGLGQGAGCTLGYHWFLNERMKQPTQKAPPIRVQDLPMDQWDLKKERRYPS